VPEKLAAVLAESGKTEAFAIQRDTLPDSLAGRDVLGRGRTGSGKTIAFALPLVARLMDGRRAQPSRPRGLVLAPTRELATQIAATVTPLAKAAGLTVTTIFGGVSQKPQEQAMRRGVDIVVACPGRLEDLMGQKIVDLGAIEVTVLDEADHMADMGFLPGVTRILKATPQGGQRMLFSATLDNGIGALVSRFLHNEVSHEVDEASVPQGAMEHRVFVVPTAEEKTALVRHLASGRGRRILFTRTKHQAKKLAKQLTANGIPAVDLHGNLGQNARERNLAAFSADPENGGVRVLVATDVAARGVHVDAIELVVHVDPPEEHKAYLHRSGRTARAGAEGIVVTVALESQRRDVQDLLRRAKITAPLEQVAADAGTVAELVGEPAEYVKPAPPQQQQTQSSKPRKAQGAGQQPAKQGGRGRGGRSAGAQTEQSGQGGRKQGEQRQRGERPQDAAAPRTAPKQGGQRRSRGGGKPASGAASTPAAPQAGRSASGRPTTGAVIGGGRSGGSRRASHPGGR
jgi:superfamily II DNA/RNA helicase